MRPGWTPLPEQDRGAFRATIAFLSRRLEERKTIDWALRTHPDDLVKRLALLELIDGPEGRQLSEPWLTAWRLIEESWDSPAPAHHDLSGPYQSQLRLKAGDRSGALVATIVDLVAPKLKVEPFSELDLRYRTLPRRPRLVEHLLSSRLTSGSIVDPGTLGLGAVDDPGFLEALANALDAAVTSGLDIARRLGWDGERGLWQLGELRRAYFVPPTERPPDEHEPDKFHHGIAPSVKLLHAAVFRLVALADARAADFARRWRATRSPIHLRLWAALSRDPKATPAADVGTFLLQLDNRTFWNLHSYPEIAELRARRFGDLDPSDQRAILARIRKHPPRNQWPKNADTDQVERARLYWTARELRRIELTGASLPAADRTWATSMIVNVPELLPMSRLDDGFLGTPKARWIPPNPDTRYDFIVEKSV